MLIFLNVILNSAAHILLKFDANAKVHAVPKYSLAIKSFVVSPLFVLAVFFFGASVLFYNKVLETTDLKIAFPIMNSLAYVIVLLAAYFIFKEQFTCKSIIGIVLIIAGLWFINMK